jgi:hypothetical protein
MPHNEIPGMLERPLIKRSNLQRKTGPAGPASTVLLGRAQRLAIKARQELSMLGLQVVVDEVAIVWRTAQELYEFANDIHRDHGWHIFNTVEDSGPIVSSDPHDNSRAAYRAKYVFVSHPSTSVRLELMVVLGGDSHIHAPLLEADSHSIAHASWKAPSIESYRSQVRRLVDAGLSCKGAYSSDYGRFSYWGAFHPYLKPRVNLRDLG